MSEPNDPLPPGWRRVRLGLLCKLVNGDAYKDADWSTSGVRIIRIQNLNDPDKPFNHWAGPLDDRVMVQDGDVLLAWSGTPGTSFGAHLWNRGSGVLNQHIFRVDLDKEQVDPQWGVHAINQELDVLIRRAHGGVGLRHVTKGEVEALEIELPPLPEQRRIAAVLREKLAEIDRARAALAAQLAAAEALPAAELRTAFDSAESRAWPRTVLAAVGTLLPSASVALAGDTELRVITTGCLTEYGFRSEGIKTSRMWSCDVAQAIARPGEILIARSNTEEMVGRASVFPPSIEPAAVSDLVHRIWPNPACDSHFLSGWFSFLLVTSYWRSRAGGASSSMKKISRSQLLQTVLPAPDLPTQCRIAAELKEKLATAAALRRVLEAQAADLDRLPAAYLHEAFAGRL